jgi:hypothetical protein
MDNCEKKGCLLLQSVRNCHDQTLTKNITNSDQGAETVDATSQSFGKVVSSSIDLLYWYVTREHARERELHLTKLLTD